MLRGNATGAMCRMGLAAGIALTVLTVAGKTYKMPDIFMVLATENPIEQEGTYPLPEAQLDRFLMHVVITYPDEATEGEIIKLGVAHRIVDKSGAWYTYGKDRIGQGKDNTRDYLKEHPEVAREIESKVLAAVGIGVAEPKAEARPEPRKAVG